MKTHEICENMNPQKLIHTLIMLLNYNYGKLTRFLIRVGNVGIKFSQSVEG